MNKLKTSLLLGCLTVVIGSCTISFLPRGKEINHPVHNDSVALTGSLKIRWKADTLSTVSYRLFTEATYTSLNDTRIPLLEKDNIRLTSSRTAEFIIEDLNPGNYVIEMFSRRRTASGSSGRGQYSSLQVTAGKQREYAFNEKFTYFPSPPGRVRAEMALKGILGIYDCAIPKESIYVNQRFPDSIEKFDPAADRVFNFESSFKDTVVVLIDQKVVAKKYMDSNSSGLADQLKIKVTSGAKIAIRTTPNDCVEFVLKDGYKYLFINRYPVRHWDIAYSNFRRIYY